MTIIVSEDPLFYYVHDTPASVRVQRKFPLRNTDYPLTTHEETILLLCKAVIERDAARDERKP